VLIVKSRQLTSQHQRINWLIGHATAIDPNQLEVQAHWARYLCILAAGLLENAIADVYSSYAKSCSSPSISSFVEATLSRIQNPKSTRFLETAKSFDQSWTEGLTNFLEQDGRKEAIDAIMSNRHLIAHGKDSNISLARVKEYLAKSIEVIEYIERQCRL
jgi:hypothetical protein